eukprot:763042-Hanusia_phi.AAC.3
MCLADETSDRSTANPAELLQSVRVRRLWFRVGFFSFLSPLSSSSSRGFSRLLAPDDSQHLVGLSLGGGREAASILLRPGEAPPTRLEPVQGMRALEPAGKEEVVVPGLDEAAEAFGGGRGEEALEAPGQLELLLALADDLLIELRQVLQWVAPALADLRLPVLVDHGGSLEAGGEGEGGEPLLAVAQLLELAAAVGADAEHVEHVDDHGVLDPLVERRVGGEGGGGVDLDEPGVQGGIEHHVEAEELVAVVAVGHQLLQLRVNPPLHRQQRLDDEVLHLLEHPPRVHSRPLQVLL